MKSDIGNSKIGRKTNKVYWRGTNGIQSTIALSNGNEIETRWLIEKGSLGQGGREGGSERERERGRVYVRLEEFVQSGGQPPLDPEGPRFARTRASQSVRVRARKCRVSSGEGCPTSFSLSFRGLFEAQPPSSSSSVLAPTGPIVPATHYRHYHEFHRLLRLCCAAPRKWQPLLCILPCHLSHPPSSPD